MLPCGGIHRVFYSNPELSVLKQSKTKLYSLYLIHAVICYKRVQAFQSAVCRPTLFSHKQLVLLQLVYQLTRSRGGKPRMENATQAIALDYMPKLIVKICWHNSLTIRLLQRLPKCASWCLRGSLVAPPPFSPGHHHVGSHKISLDLSATILDLARTKMGHP